MIKTPVKQVHNHKKVWTHEVMDALRASDSLCLNCDMREHMDLTTGDKFPCRIANQFLLICQQHNVALAVTRCPFWVPSDGVIDAS